MCDEKAQGRTSHCALQQGSGNVFADLGLPDADKLLVKAELTRQLHHRLKALGLTQKAAAERLGLGQPDVSRLMSGRLARFSVEKLLSLLNKLNFDIEIIVRARPPRSRTPGQTRVAVG